jgi:DNA invertase Pin-like site-specific DNA recombinase
MRAALHARVSTNEQAPGMQLSDFTEYVERGTWSVAGEYIDVASGSPESRPQLDKLMADARKRKFDAVVVYRYDRFAQSLRQLVNALEEFRVLGIQFVSNPPRSRHLDAKRAAGLRDFRQHCGI